MDHVSSIASELLSERNIAGMWAVIGAFVALVTSMVGILLNNFLENRRKKIERQRRIVFDSYIGALQYIAATQIKILRAGTGEAEDVSDSQAHVLEKYYILSLVASPPVVKSFLQLSSNLSTSFFSLGKGILDLKEVRSQIELNNTLMQMATKQIDQSLEDMKLYNERGIKNPQKFALYQESFENYSVQRDEFMSNLNLLHKKEAETRLSLLKDTYAIMSKILPEIFNLILLMRKDIERKMKSADVNGIKLSLDNISDKLKSEMDAFMSDIDSRITQ